MIRKGSFAVPSADRGGDSTSDSSGKPPTEQVPSPTSTTATEMGQKTPTLRFGMSPGVFAAVCYSLVSIAITLFNKVGLLLRSTRFSGATSAPGGNAGRAARGTYLTL